MTKKNVSWPLFTVIGALGLGAALLAPACTVSSGDDDDLDVDAGAGGSTGGSSGGSKATGGSAGSTGGSSGGSSGGSGGSTGGSDGGTGGSTGGSAGAAQMLACDGETVIPFPNCEADDTLDECTECLKVSCCETWRACLASDETSGDFVCGWGGPEGSGEFGCIAACMRDGATDVGECVGECMAASWEDAPCSDGTITQATNDLLGCMEEEAACQAECFE